VLVLRKEIRFAELSRELGIDQSVVRRWQHLVERGSRTAAAANEDVVPASVLPELPLPEPARLGHSA
jgi:hypothetical protein